MKIHWFLKRYGEFEGGGEREPTHKHTHTRINGLGGREWLFGGLESGGGGGGERGEGESSGRANYNRL